VEKLRQWMDLPKRKGLESFVGNLLILAFAEQTNRAFYWNARPFPNPSLDNLRDDMELRQQELPDEAEWEAARRRAKEVFGLGDFDAALLTAANVAALAGKVQKLAERDRQAAHDLVREVRLSLARMGATDAEIAPASRWRTAQAADALVTGLAGKDATAALKHLAQSKLDTSAAAMSKSLETAAGVLHALRQTRWEMFDSVAHIHDEDQPEANALLADLKDALASDEYALALAPHLDTALTQAIRLLRPKKPPITRTPTAPPTPSPIPPDGWKMIEQGQDQITPGNWEEQIAKLKALLGEGGDVRLEIHWSLQKRGPR
jgi:hypothetical protein